MEPDWVRLGRELAGARKRVGLTQKALAEQIHVSRTPIQAIERGEEFDKPTGTMRAFAHIVGWAEGSIERVLAGGDPILLSEENPQDVRATSAGKDDLPLRITAELGEGELLDTTVLDLTPYGSNARMIVVVRGTPDASKEEIRRDLLAWRRAQRDLLGLGNEAGGSDEPPAAGQA